MTGRKKLSPAENLAIWRYNTSLDYLLGTGVAKDTKRAFRWNRDAARSGYPDAVLAMGWFYHNGIGVDRNLRRARFWYVRAARAQDPHAWFSLGQLAYDADKFVEAVAWFRKAAQRRHPRASYYLARLYLDGRGARRNVAIALKLLTGAVRQGHPEAKRLLHSRRLRRERDSSLADKPLRRRAKRAADCRRSA